MSTFTFDDPALAPQDRPPVDLLNARIGEDGTPVEPVDLDALTTSAPAPAAAAPVTDTGVLGALRAEISREVLPPDLELPVPHRPGWSATFRVAFTEDEMAAWDARAAQAPPDMRKVTRAALALVALNTGLLHDGTKAADELGTAVTFRSVDFVGSQPGPISAVRTFWLADGHLDAAYRALLVASGWAAELAPIHRAAPDPS